MTTIAHISLARKAMLAHLEKFGEPMREIRVRPDDYQLLAKEMGVVTPHPSPGASDSLFGIPIVLDDAAARLGEKQ